MIEIFDRFKQIDNRYIRPCLIREHKAHEPKILETYSKLTMRDAMEYMRRNGSTVMGGGAAESMAVLFRNYTANNLNNRYNGHHTSSIYVTICNSSACPLRTCSKIKELSVILINWYRFRYIPTLLIIQPVDFNWLISLLNF